MSIIRQSDEQAVPKPSITLSEIKKKIPNNQSKPNLTQQHINKMLLFETMCDIGNVNVPLTPDELSEMDYFLPFDEPMVLSFSSPPPPPSFTELELHVSLIDSDDEIMAWESDDDDDVRVTTINMNGLTATRVVIRYPCNGVTKKGQHCSNYRVTGELFCKSHTPKKRLASQICCNK
jgi:hypothetical protein